MDPDRNLTEILRRLEEGRPEAGEELFQVVYSEMRRLAAAQMAGQSAAHTLQPTALVHEAYLKLVGGEAAFADSAHFFNACARSMRSILVDHARARGAKKRGGGAGAVTLRETTQGTIDPGEEVLAVNDALAHLGAVNGDMAKVVELRYFAGLTVPETAAVMRVQERTVYRLWERARVWLAKEMGA